ncbi:uncharacterized protein CDV56_106946 [Aspergillus thermomutatus]|uniref:Uncharacterized protein n=1 Tax=Aspergillus thermomutatus TaxID=41047 RepID=A0A397HAB7_ASPTH|nr:uncharacterized protein CDV56_106946 [Aspergillus thermomutatus]RHZ60002.1 hypothetical protein CDV56_106946 [Aspergillus thermomutatus]
MDPPLATGPTTNFLVNNHPFTNGMANFASAHPVNFSQDFNCFSSPGPIVAPVPVSSGIPVHTPNPASSMNLEHRLSPWPYNTLETRTESPVEHHAYDFAFSAVRNPSEFTSQGTMNFVGVDCALPAGSRQHDQPQGNLSGLTFVMEDGIRPARHRESRVQTKEESDERREKNKKLKEMGGTVVSFCQDNGEAIDVWVVNVADLDATNMNTSSDLSQQLILTILKCIQSEEMDKFEMQFHGSSLVQTAVTMHKLLSAILCLSKTQVHMRATDVEQTRIVMFYMLALCLRGLCEFSDELGSEAYSLIKQKIDCDGEPAGMKNDCSGSNCVNPVWVAVGLYHRVLEALSRFELPQPMASIFAGVKTRSDMVLSNTSCVKEKTPHIFGSKLEKDKMEAEKKVFFEKHIPPVSCRQYFNVAIWSLPFDQKLPPTAIHRQAHLFSGVSYDAEFLLDESFWHSTLAEPFAESQPQDLSQILGSGDDWENLEAELSQIHPFDEGLMDFEAFGSNTLVGDWLTPSPTDSWGGTMIVNSAQSSMIGSY